MSLAIGKRIGRQAKQIVYNMYKYFKNRKADSSSYEHQNDINLINLVSSATCLAKSTVTKIVSEGNLLAETDGTVKFSSPQKKKQFYPKRVEIDNFTEGVIRRKITQFYVDKKEVPSLIKINSELKEENILDCSREFLRKTVHRLGFKYNKCESKRKLLVERADIMSLRWHYINSIKKYRTEKRPIIFLDETYVNQSHTVQKCWTSASERGIMTDIGKGLRLIILHAGSRNGFVENGLLIFKSHSKSGDYHGDMNSVNFEKWIREKLLPNIPPQSIIVMDNAAYHCTVIDKKPTMSSTKTAMTEWLTRKNILFDSSLRKCDLIEIINNHQLEKKYKINEIINQNGHTVLRLPPYHPDLNPIEMVWGDIKGELARNYVKTTLEEKKNILINLFENYSAEKWARCDDHIIKNEDHYYNQDRVFDSNFDEFIINLGQDSEDSEEEDENSDSEMEYD